MATEGIRIQAPPTTSEAKNTLGIQERKGSVKDTELHPGSPPRVLELKPDELSGPPVVTGALEPPTAEDTNGPKTGKKRQVNESQNSVDGDEESTGKKQKIKQPSQAENGVTPSTVSENNPVTSSSGEQKKKPGRPKKLKDIAKRLTPRSTEGIGSRTRSQTKTT